MTTEDMKNKIPKNHNIQHNNIPKKNTIFKLAEITKKKTLSLFPLSFFLFFFFLFINCSSSSAVFFLINHVE